MNGTDPTTSGGTASPGSIQTSTPTPVGTQSPPKPRTTPAQTTVVQIQPIPVPVGPATTKMEINYMPIALGIAALAVIVSTLLLRKKPETKKEEKEEEDKKCLDFKQRMEEKLKEITDLRAKLEEKAKDKVKSEVKKKVKNTVAEGILFEIESANKEYERLKDLYDKCMAGISLPMKRNIFIFHGTAGFPGENWFPWLKTELENRGQNVIVPQFPTTTDTPVKINEWFKVLGNYGDNFNEEMMLIGHSMGGVLALRVLEMSEYPIDTVVLVATPINGLKFDWHKIRNNAKRFVVYQSDNDPYVNIENGNELARNLGVELTFIPKAGHFNTAAGYTKFTQLLEKLDSFL